MPNSAILSYGKRALLIARSMSKDERRYELLIRWKPNTSHVRMTLRGRAARLGRLRATEVVLPAMMWVPAR